MGTTASWAVRKNTDGIITDIVKMMRTKVARDEGPLRLVGQTAAMMKKTLCIYRLDFYVCERIRT
jgi:hypothetical protein